MTLESSKKTFKSPEKKPSLHSQTFAVNIFKPIHKFQLTWNLIRFKWHGQTSQSIKLINVVEPSNEPRIINTLRQSVHENRHNKKKRNGSERTITVPSSNFFFSTRSTCWPFLQPTQTDKILMLHTLKQFELTIEWRGGGQNGFCKRTT